MSRACNPGGRQTVPTHEPFARRSYPPGLEITDWLAGDGWSHRAFRLAPAEPVAGRLLFLGGRGDFFEKYLEAIQHWAQQRWEVSGFDWRGQGGSGSLHPDGCCHLADFSRLVDDLAQFISQWQAKEEGPHVVVGHSMGGHVLLRALAEGACTVDGFVLLAPMLGLRAGPLGGSGVRMLGQLGRVPGMAQRPLWKGPSRYNPGQLTACPDRHADKLWWKQARPELGRGGPTWLWLGAASRSIRHLERTLRRAPPSMPGIILTGARDRVVDNRATARIASRLPQAVTSRIEGGGHELLRESDPARRAAMGRIDDFLSALGR